MVEEGRLATRLGAPGRARIRGTEKEDSGCRLVQLERTLFEVERVGDVSGFEIPGRYFDFVRRGDWSVLEPVLHHNRLDLLSLAGVTARAARLLRAGVTACTRAEEAALLGRELHRRAEPSEAEACYRRGLDDLAAAHPLRGETLAGLARLLRSQRRYDEAAVCWTEITGLRGLRAGLRLEATEALAVHFEHRRRDLERAHSYAERARHADLARPGSSRAHRGHPPGSAAGPVASEAVWSPSRERGRRGLAGTGAVLEGGP